MKFRRVLHLVALIVNPIATMLGLGKKARAVGQIIEKVDQELPKDSPPAMLGG